MTNWYDVLEGAQIVEMDKDHIVVEKNGKTYELIFETDYGDCCGYAHIAPRLYYEENSIRNPVITNVTVEEEDGLECSKIAITFFGESKPLAAIYCECGSGSGWSYGACVTITCKPLDIDEVVCSW